MAQRVSIPRHDLDCRTRGCRGECQRARVPRSHFRWWCQWCARALPACWLRPCRWRRAAWHVHDREHTRDLAAWFTVLLWVAVIGFLAWLLR